MVGLGTETHRDAPRFHGDAGIGPDSCAVRPCPSASKFTKCWKEKEVDCLPKDTGMFMVHGIFTCFRFVDSITINHRHFNQINHRDHFGISIKSNQSNQSQAGRHSISVETCAVLLVILPRQHIGSLPVRTELRAPSSAELQTWRRHSALVKSGWTQHPLLKPRRSLKSWW